MKILVTCPPMINMIENYSATLGVSKVNTFKLIAAGTAVVMEEMNDG